MIKPQVPLSDEPYAKSKSVARARKTTLAGLTRRGLEYMILHVAILNTGRQSKIRPVARRNSRFSSTSGNRKVL